MEMTTLPQLDAWELTRYWHQCSVLCSQVLGTLHGTARYCSQTCSVKYGGPTIGPFNCIDILLSLERLTFTYIFQNSLEGKEGLGTRLMCSLCRDYAAQFRWYRVPRPLCCQSRLGWDGCCASTDHLLPTSTPLDSEWLDILLFSHFIPRLCPKRTWRSHVKEGRTSGEEPQHIARSHQVLNTSLDLYNQSRR